MPFNTALSGIRGANSDIQVTGNNIANAGTIGFKKSRAEFGDMYAGSILGSGANSPGNGVKLQNIRQQFTQGNRDVTERDLDLAINGEGFFVVSDQGDQLYTRGGAFGLADDGSVITNTGANLQGFAADDQGNLDGQLSNLVIDVDTQDPRQTTLSSGKFNLDANQDVLESVGTSFETDGSSIAVPQFGLLDPTTTTLDIGAVTTPIDFSANNTTFDISLSGSSPASGNGTVSVTLDSSTANTLEDVANLINSAIYDDASPINVEAVVNGGNLEFRDLTEGVGSAIDITAVTGTNDLSTQLAAAGSGSSVAGIPAVDNGYVDQTIEFITPDGETLNFTSEAGASAAATAAELNSLSGLTASARTEATIMSGTFDNSNNNLTINGVTLSATTMGGLADEINNLSTSSLANVTARVNGSGDLELTSEVGTDLEFGFSGTMPAGTVEVAGRSGSGTQTVASRTDAAVVGGSVSMVMDEGYQVSSVTPAVGNLFAPLNDDSFTDVPINAFDPDDQATYNHATTSRVYDSLGNSHTMEQYFVKQPYDPEDPATSPNHWVMYVQIDGENVGDPDPTLPSPENTEPTMASFNVHFNSDGTMNESLTDTMLISNWTPKDDSGAVAGALGPLNVLQGGQVPVEDPPTSSNFEIDLEGSTQFGVDFAVEDQQQDGRATGRLTGLDIAQDGMIFARFTNGEAQVLGQVALANFNNVEGLTPVGDTMWAQSAETGEAVIGAPRTSSLGDIKSGALEESNVELSDQLVNLIVAQRNYQANSKTIETANQTTQTLINMR